MKNPSFMTGLKKAKAPADLADRGLVTKTVQALAGAVLPDDDYDVALLDRLACHAMHATTRDSGTQGGTGNAATTSPDRSPAQSCRARRRRHRAFFRAAR